MLKITKSYSHYPKTMANTELGSQRQVEMMIKNWGQNKTSLTEADRKKLKRGQFAFGSAFPYIFDGLANAATHYQELFQETDENYYVIKLPIDDLYHLSLMGYERYNREYFTHELLRRGNIADNDEAQHLRCIPIEKGTYISAQPLMLVFSQKNQEEIPPAEIKRLMNLKTYNEHTQVIKTVFVYALKALINPVFKGYAGGWFSCPNALQAKIVHMLKTRPPAKKAVDKFKLDYFGDLEPHFLRKYFLYLNSLDGSQKTSYIDADAIDLWEHVAPAEIKVDKGYKYIRDWFGAKYKLQKANRFFAAMEAEGLMEGAKAFPTPQPKGIYYDRNRQKYRIYYKRSPEITLKKKELYPDLS